VGDPNSSTTILYPMRTGNTYRHVWTVGAEVGAEVGGGASGSAAPEHLPHMVSFENHEYMLFRYATVEYTPGYNNTATCAEADEHSTSE
jgi:hypothetical protein